MRRLWLYALLFTLSCLFAGCHLLEELTSQESSSSSPSPAPSSPESASPRAQGPAYVPQGTRRLPFTDPDRLTEANRTLDMIEQGGPFPHRADGTVFFNREGRLPPQPVGYYREYTVRTPGIPTRGARRIIRGREGETFYTDDHYQTFVPIDPRRY